MKLGCGMVLHLQDTWVNSALLCVCVYSSDEMTVGGLFYKMYKHAGPTSMHMKCPFMPALSCFCEWQVTCGKPAVCVSSWLGMAICLGGKTEVFIWARWTDSVPCQSGASAVSI